jgi:hypothetical protein
MLLAIACTEAIVDDSASIATDTTDSAATYDSVSDTPADTDSGSGVDPVACTSTCDCAEGDLCYDGACATAGPAVHLYRATMARMLASMDESGGFDAESAYPTEAMISLASGAELLCDEELAAAALTRAEYALSWETDDHFLVWSGYPYITRDYQARHIYNLWAAGHALGDRALLAAADDAAAAMLTLERLPYEDEYTIFCAVYEVSTHACDASTLWIDVNQNSEIGLAFALLTSDPSSAFYSDALALEVVDQELRAAVSLQTASGEIPIGSDYGYEDDHDTLYGSYAAYSWTLAAPWTSADLAPHIALAADWLAPLSDADPVSHRTYPYPYDGEISLAEGFFRLPLLSATGTLDPAFLDYWWDETIATNGETYSVFLPIWMATYSGTPLADILPPEE